jgi:hypothetical protein
MLILAVALLGASQASLTDGELVHQSTLPFDKAQKIGRREVLGVHDGRVVIAEYPCGDVCPSSTIRIIHYDLDAGPECARHGGVVVDLWVPMGAAVGKRPFCVPSVLADRLKD